MNDSLRPLSVRAEGPSNATEAASSDSSDFDSSNSSDSYNGDDARRYLREWRNTQDLYSEATRLNGELENYLKATEVALHATEEETNRATEEAWARLAEADSMVAGT